MRILVLSSAVVGAEEAPGEEWRHLSASVFKGNLYARTAEDLVDYDVFVIDVSKMTQAANVENMKLIQSQIVERTAGGGCLISFAFPGNLPWSPIPYTSRGEVKGQRFRLEPGGEDPIRAFFEKRQAEITYKTQFYHTQGWTAVAWALDTYPIAAYGSHGSGLVFMLPEFKNRAAALRDLLDNVVPKLLPELQTAVPSVAGEEAPDWIGEFPIPGADDLAGELDRLNGEINRLREEREAIDHKRRELLEYRGLLWLEGKPLEVAVQKALNLLGIAVEPKQPVDLFCATPGGGEVYIEVEGTKGPVQIRKGRQLLGYIAEAEEPAEVRGAIVGNPHCGEHPHTRPDGDLFSRPLTNLAKAQRWPLVTTAMLFGWVTRHLAGDKRAAAEARKILGL